MRELKFRAWVGSENTDFIDMPSHYEYDVTLVNGKYADVESGWDIHGTYDNVPVEQYTGLKDKNGKEIYEGDILESTWNGDRAVVVWNDVEGEWEHYADFNTHSKYSGSVVIGNIHENANLLEEEE